MFSEKCWHNQEGASVGADQGGELQGHCHTRHDPAALSITSDGKTSNNVPRAVLKHKCGLHW